MYRTAKCLITVLLCLTGCGGRAQTEKDGGGGGPVGGGGSDGGQMPPPGNANYSVSFVPLVGGMPFSCKSTYTGIGKSKTTIKPVDFRMYVHNVQLIRATGEKLPLNLVDD